MIFLKNTKIITILNCIIIFLLYPDSLFANTFINPNLDNRSIFIIEDEGDLVQKDSSYNTRNIVKKFYQSNIDDVYDFLLITSNFDVLYRPNYLSLQNNVSGIGREKASIDGWDINSEKLLGVLNLKNINSFKNNKSDFTYYLDWPRIIVHELIHEWGMDLGMYSDDSYGRINDTGGHWARNVLLPSVINGGNNIQSRIEEDGYALLNTSRAQLSPEDNMILDPLFSYLAGFSCKEEVIDEKYIVIDPKDVYKAKAKIIRYLTVEDIIEKEGPRIPNCHNSQKSFQIGIIFVLKNNTRANYSELEKLKILAQEIPKWWSASTKEKSKIVTTMPTIVECLESDWSFVLSPNSCPENKKQNKIWTKNNTCTNGVTHPKSEIVDCINQTFGQNNHTRSIVNEYMYNQLRGKILLTVERSGEAYYVNSNFRALHYLGRPKDAFAIMREHGTGITNNNLDKISIGLSNPVGIDSDGDGLVDKLEDAIGTNKNSIDSDGDGYGDKQEIESDYNPRRSGKINIDDNFAINQKGKIFIQVEGNGEAWYVNPKDRKRYFLGHPDDAFQVMRELGLGISNKDFDNL